VIKMDKTHPLIAVGMLFKINVCSGGELLDSFIDHK